MFRTVSVHLQEQSFFHKLYIAFGIRQTYGTVIYQIRHTAYKMIAPEPGLIHSETCRAYIVNRV